MLKLVKWVSSNPNAINYLNTENPTAKNLKYIMLSADISSNKNSVLNIYFDSILAPYYKGDDASYKTDTSVIKNSIAGIKSILKGLKDGTIKPSWGLFATGDFLSTIQSSSMNGSTNITAGTVGISYQYGQFGILGKITLASSQDTISKGYGSQILSQARGKGIGAGLLGISWDFTKKTDSTSRMWSAKVLLGGSSQLWTVDSSKLNNFDSIMAKKDNIFTPSVTVFSIDALLNYGINSNANDSFRIGNNNYAFGLNASFGFAGRVLGGDLFNPFSNTNSTLYSKGYYANEFPTKRKAFFGAEGGLSINVGPVLADFTLYYFFKNKKDVLPISGLSGWQASFGASINLDLYHSK